MSFFYALAMDENPQQRAPSASSDPKKAGDKAATALAALAGPEAAALKASLDILRGVSHVESTSICNGIVRGRGMRELEITALRSCLEGLPRAEAAPMLAMIKRQAIETVRLEGANDHQINLIAEVFDQYGRLMGCGVRRGQHYVSKMTFRLGVGRSLMVTLAFGRNDTERDEQNKPTYDLCAAAVIGKFELQPDLRVWTDSKKSFFKTSTRMHFEEVPRGIEANDIQQFLDMALPGLVHTLMTLGGPNANKQIAQ